MKTQKGLIAISGLIAFSFSEEKVNVILSNSNEVLECEVCHTSDSWNTILLDGFNHSDANYELIGQHANIKCKQCHTGQLIDEIHTFTIQDYACFDCHTDIHKNQFNLNPNCEKCHNYDEWSPSTFSIEEHTKTDFSLTGAHVATPCSKCHFKNKENYVVYTILNAKCNDCHDDVHNNQFRSNVYFCSDCHSTQNWNIDNFDHDKTQYPLDGEHFNVSCDKCHFSKSNQYVEFIVYKPIKHDCIDCHNLKDEG